MQVNKKGLRFLLICIALTSVIFYIRSIRIDKIEKFGVYQLAYVYKKSQAKNGTSYTFKYEYKEAEYEGEILSLGLDSVFIIKFLPDNPKMWMVALKNPSPCMVSAKYSAQGLKTLPDSCN